MHATLQEKTVTLLPFWKITCKCMSAILKNAMQMHVMFQRIIWKLHVGNMRQKYDSTQRTFLKVI